MYDLRSIAQRQKKTDTTSHLWLFQFHSSFITARKRGLGQGNIFSSVCQEFCLSACWDNPRSRHHPPWPGSPLGSGTPPLHSTCWEIWSTSGRYASYWNAILFSYDFSYMDWTSSYYFVDASLPYPYTDLGPSLYYQFCWPIQTRRYNDLTPSISRGKQNSSL